MLCFIDLPFNGVFVTTDIFNQRWYFSQLVSMIASSVTSFFTPLTSIHHALSVFVFLAVFLPVCLQFKTNLFKAASYFFKRCCNDRPTYILLEKYSIFFLCKNLVDFNEARLQEATLNLHTHTWFFFSLVNNVIIGDISWCHLSKESGFFAKTKSLNQVHCSSRSVIFLTMKIRREH